MSLVDRCEVSEWSAYGACEAVTRCAPCDYGAGPGSWTRPAGTARKTARASPAPMSAAARPAAMTEKMARKVAAKRGSTLAAERERPDEAAACVDGMAGRFPCSRVDLVHWIAARDIDTLTDELSDLWGWTSDDGVEWILATFYDGTAFINAADGSVRGVMPIPDDASGDYWRDVKTYGHHAYVVGDDSRGFGLQVFDLRRLADEDPAGGLYAPDAHYDSFGADAHYDSFGDAHNLVVDEESATLWAVGTSTCGGGLRAYDLSDPAAPAFAGCTWDETYVHDAQCVVYRGPDVEHRGKEICVLYTVTRWVYVVDVTDLAAGKLLGSVKNTAKGTGATHQGWMNCQQDAIIFGDEDDEPGALGTYRTFVADISDLDDPKLMFEWDSGVASIDHNQYVCGAFSYQANYESGLAVVDVSRIRTDGTLDEVAHFDTHPARDRVAWGGSWSVYPFFPSGRVVVNSVADGVAVVSLAGVEAETRTRAVLSRGPGDVCPPLVEERTCRDAAPSPPRSTRPHPGCVAFDEKLCTKRKYRKACSWTPRKACRAKYADEPGATDACASLEKKQCRSLRGENDAKTCVWGGCHPKADCASLKKKQCKSESNKQSCKWKKETRKCKAK